VLAGRNGEFPLASRLREPRGALVELRRRWCVEASPGGSHEQRSELRLVSEAVPSAAVTVVRLHAPLPVLEKRIRLREPASPEGEIDGARWWMRHLDQVCLEDHLVETGGRTVGEVARDVLRLARWLP
jgi:hypothetical protein